MSTKVAVVEREAKMRGSPKEGVRRRQKCAETSSLIYITCLLAKYPAVFAGK